MNLDNKPTIFFCPCCKSPVQPEKQEAVKGAWSDRYDEAWSDGYDEALSSVNKDAIAAARKEAKR